MNVRLAFISAVLAIAFAPASHAAPQLLGLVASAEPIPMTCESGKCSAEISAFCLEQSRSGPLDGTAYEAVDWRGLTLVATAADGSVRRLPASPYLRVTAARGYSAVTASVDEEVRERLGAAKLALAVARRVTLVPVATAGDPSPLTGKEIGEATANLRPIASDVFESGERSDMVTARVLNRLINALPRMAGGVALDLAAPDGLWDKVVGGGPRLGNADAGIAQAALAYESCRRGAHFVQGLTLRRCLEASHDALMSSLNEEYWRIVGAGS